MSSIYRRMLFVSSFLLLFLVQVFEANAQKTKKKTNENTSTAKNQTAISSTEAEYYFVDGMKFYILENYEKALENFQKASVLSPSSASIHFKIAETYYQMANSIQAEIYAKKALDADKENKYHYLLLAKLYEDRQKHEEAAEAYRNLIDSKVGSPEYNYELANIYLKQQKYEKAIEAFNKIEKAFGINESTTLQKQKIYLELNQTDKAIEEGKKLIETAPDNPIHLVSLAELLIANNKNEEALSILENAAKNDTTDPRVALLLSRIYTQKGEKEKAVAQLKRAFADSELDANEKVNLMIYFMQGNEAVTMQNDFAELAQSIVKTHPANAKAQALYADILILKEDKKTALGHYLTSARLDNSRSEIWQQVLRLDADANAIDSVIRHADEALEVFPNQAIFWLYSGMGHLGKKNYESAVTSLEEGKRLAFSNTELLNDFNLYLGDGYNGMKQYGESDAAFDAVLKNAPDNAQALNNYSYYLSLRKEKLSLARGMAERLVEKNPENATYLDTYAWVLYSSGDYKKARKFLEKAVKSTSSGVVVEHYGDVLFKLGESDKALEQWQKAKLLGGATNLIDKKIADKNLYD